MIKLGEKIKSLRKQKNISQEVFANFLGVSFQAVSKWERNLSCPDIDSLPRLAEIFDISVDELMQVKDRSKQETTSKSEKIINIALKAIPLAMGVAVTVSAFLENLDTYSALRMLGIAVACLGIDRLKDIKE